MRISNPDARTDRRPDQSRSPDRCPAADNRSIAYGRCQGHDGADRGTDDGSDGSADQVADHGSHGSSNHRADDGSHGSSNHCADDGSHPSSYGRSNCGRDHNGYVNGYGHCDNQCFHQAFRSRGGSHFETGNPPGHGSHAARQTGRVKGAH